MARDPRTGAEFSSNWDDLRMVLAVARAGSLRAGATLLGVDHSTASRRIARLEEQLGVRVFDRVRRGLALTADGEDVVRAAEACSDQMAGLETQLLGRDQSLRGRIQVTMPELFGSLVLMEDLAAFCRRYPEIELDLNCTPEVLSISERESDVALRIVRRGSPPEGLVGRRIFRVAFAAYATRAYLADHPAGSPHDPARWVGWDETIYPALVSESGLPERAIRGRFRGQFVQIAAVKAGVGMGMLPCCVGDTEPGLLRVPPGHAHLAWDVWLLTHRDLRASARVRAFIDFVTAATTRLRPLLEGGAPRAGQDAEHQAHP